MQAAPAGLMYADPTKAFKRGARSLLSRTDIPASGCRQGFLAALISPARRFAAGPGRCADKAVSHAHGVTTRRSMRSIGPWRWRQGMPTPSWRDLGAPGWERRRWPSACLCSRRLRRTDHPRLGESLRRQRLHGIVCGSLVGVITESRAHPRRLDNVARYRRRGDPDGGTTCGARDSIRQVEAQPPGGRFVIRDGLGGSGTVQNRDVVLRPLPGSGSQHVGMGADLFEARPKPSRRDQRTRSWGGRWGMHLEGPEEVLTSTDRAQPALFALSCTRSGTSSLPGWRGPPVGAAGHSLGEYTALAAAGVIDYPAALSLVAARGGRWTWRRTRRTVRDGCAAPGRCGRRRSAGQIDPGMAAGWVANINAPARWWWPAVPRTSPRSPSGGVSWGCAGSVPLKGVRGIPSPLMLPAVEPLREALAAVNLQPARLPGVVQRPLPFPCPPMTYPLCCRGRSPPRSVCHDPGRYGGGGRHPICPRRTR